MTCVRLYDGWCTEQRSVAHQLRPSPGVCSVCPHYDGPARGLGDIVHTVAQVTGVAAVINVVAPDCGCQQRREALNQAVPLPKSGT